MFYNNINLPSAYLPYTVRISEVDTSFRTITLRHVVKNTVVGSVNMHEIPFCCGMLFISNLVMYHRRQNGSKELFSLIDIAAIKGEYAAVQCVIPGAHTKQKNLWLHKLFEKHGFRYIKGSRVKNKRTSNYLYTYQKDYT